MCVNVREKVRVVLDDFFVSKTYEEDDFDDSLLGVVLDEDDRDILAKAIAEVLEKK